MQVQIATRNPINMTKEISCFVFCVLCLVYFILFCLFLSGIRLQRVNTINLTSVWLQEGTVLCFLFVFVFVVWYFCCCLVFLLLFGIRLQRVNPINLASVWLQRGHPGERSNFLGKQHIPRLRLNIWSTNKTNCLNFRTSNSDYYHEHKAYSIDVCDFQWPSP